ncbi:unnamed protein product, partial [Polarella glacialis]
ELRRDREFMLNAVRAAGSAITYASSSLLHDRSFMLAAMQANSSVLCYVPLHQSLRRDPEFMLPVVKVDGLALRFAHRVLRGDLDLVLAAVRADPGALRYASDELQDHPKVRLAVHRECCKDG